MEHRKSGHSFLNRFFSRMWLPRQRVSGWVSLTSRTYARDERAERDWRPMADGEASRKEERVEVSNTIGKRIMTLRIFRNVGVCDYVLFKLGLFKCLPFACCFEPCNNWLMPECYFIFKICVWINADYLCHYYLLGSLIFYIEWIEITTIDFCKPNFKARIKIFVISCNII